MNKNEILEQIIDFLKTRSTLILWLVLLIISAFVFLNVFPTNKDPSLWYISFCFVAMFMTMAIFELRILFIDILPKKLKKKPKPKVFEFGFFLILFIATISATYVITMIFQPGLTIEDKLEIIRQYFWFFGLYGVAIAFGIYHYIFRMDDDFPENKDNKKINGNGGDYMNFGILGKIGLVLIVLFFILTGIIILFSLTNGFYSIDIGLLSVGIALIAVDLADSTDRKIKNHLNGIFLQNLNFIEETRTYYNDFSNYPKKIYDEELLSWKTLQGVIVAWGLNKKIRNKSPISNKYQDQLVVYFKITMECLFDGLKLQGKTWTDLLHNKKDNFAKAYAMVEDFYAEKNTWKELNELLGNKMNKTELKDLIKRKNKAKSELIYY